MKQRILVIGTGFAGMWSALAAARLLDREGVAREEVEVLVVAPRPALAVRPRFYEADPGAMSAPLAELFAATDIRYLAGTVEAIHTPRRVVEVLRPDGMRVELGYDRLILAAGSRLAHPAVPGLAEHAFNIDRMEDAAVLERHCRELARLPDTPARNTVVIGGGGFTGIEIAAEMPARMRSILGDRTDVQVIIVEQAPQIGPDLGPGPRPVIQRALSDLGVVCRLGTSVVKVGPEGVETSTGEWIESRTVIWTGGVRANPLAAQVPGDHDSLGRLVVAGDLHVPRAPEVFATGDAACAATDDAGHHTMMSCQHALEMGRFSGHNAAASLLGLATLPYRQPDYVTGLDLGPWGAVHTTGWERTVVLQGAQSKVRKQWINSVYIYPPPADRAAAFVAADPLGPRPRQP